MEQLATQGYQTASYRLTLSFGPAQLSKILSPALNHDACAYRLS